MERAKKISLLSAMVVAGFSVSVAYHYVQGAYLGRSYPYDTFLFFPGAHGTDFRDVVEEGGSLDPYRLHGSAQYPLLALVGYGFSLIPTDHQYAFYLLVVGGLFLLLSTVQLWLGDWRATATHVFVIAFLSYPFLFAVDRGNFELLVVVFLLAFIYFFRRQRYLCSAVLLSFAIALKLFPVILLALFMPVRQYRAMAAGLGMAAALTVGSLLVFRGGVVANASFLLHGLNLGSNWQFSQFILLSTNTVQRGVSLLTLLKILAYETRLFLGSDPYRFLGYYIVAAGVAGVLLVIYAYARERALWKQAAVLTFAMLLLPHISADYKLLHVFVPLYLFVNSKTRSRLDAAYLVLFGLLLIPKDYYYFTKVISDTYRDTIGAHDVSIAVPANIIILITMTLLIVVSGLFRRALATRAVSSGSPGLEPASLPSPREGAESPSA